MAYLVLARKYRPQRFEDVVGQNHVAKTLTNAILADRVAHAILFSGPRGTGKTTLARILAKALNCQEGPTSAPCNRCRSCEEITNGSAADVFEIDGASNNGVDQVRDLRDNVKYMPQHSRFKIYIIDEVHMLSVAAFNALLKTLEEPPSHVLFFFATTESHKIPATILSRCQRHDLRRIDLPAITDHLAAICRSEKIQIDAESLDIISREADGCMRDALSLLDQVISFSSGPVDPDQVRNMLGAVDRKTVADTAAAIVQGNIETILETIETVFDTGQELQKFFGDLVTYFRNLFVVKLGTSGQRLLSLPHHEIEQMGHLSAPLSPIYLSQIVDRLLKEQPAVKYSPQPRLAIEMACIKAAQAIPAVSIETLIEKIDRLRTEFHESPASLAAPRPTADAPAAAQPPQTAETMTAEDTTPRYRSSDERSDEEKPETGAQLPENDPVRLWETLGGAITARHPSMAAPLANTVITGLEGDDITLKITGTAFNENLIKRKKKLLEQVISETIGRSMVCHLRFERVGEDAKKKTQQDGELKAEALRHPLVSDAVEIFNGEVIDVKTL